MRRAVVAAILTLIVSVGAEAAKKPTLKSKHLKAKPAPAKVHTEAKPGASAISITGKLVPGGVALATIPGTAAGDTLEAEFTGGPAVVIRYKGRPAVLLAVDLDDGKTGEAELEITRRRGEVIMHFARTVMVNPKKFKKSYWGKRHPPSPEVKERLAREREMREAIFARISPLQHWKEFRSPLSIALKVMSPFGAIRTFYDVEKGETGKRRHYGVDLRAIVKTAVKAKIKTKKGGTKLVTRTVTKLLPIKTIADGIVVATASHLGHGNVVIVDHGLGVFSFYLHLSKWKTHVDASVSAGDVIGITGSTGHSTGPHLHLTVYIRGAIVDPLALINLL